MSDVPSAIIVRPETSPENPPKEEVSNVGSYAHFTWITLGGLKRLGLPVSV